MPNPDVLLEFRQPHATRTTPTTPGVTARPYANLELGSTTGTARDGSAGPRAADAGCSIGSAAHSQSWRRSSNRGPIHSRRHTAHCFAAHAHCCMCWKRRKCRWRRWFARSG